MWWLLSPPKSMSTQLIEKEVKRIVWLDFVKFIAILILISKVHMV